MHYGAVIRITTQVIFYNFAKGFRVQTLVKFADGLVHIFFAGGNPALLVTIGIQWFSYFDAKVSNFHGNLTYQGSSDYKLQEQE
jgi:hypothetical protein